MVREKGFYTETGKKCKKEIAGSNNIQVRACAIATKIKYETMKCRGAVEISHNIKFWSRYLHSLMIGHILDSDENEPDFWGPLGGFHTIPNSPESISDEAITQEEESTTSLFKYVILEKPCVHSLTGCIGY